MQVAICGLGRMGAGMARRAARGGHDVVAWNRTEAVATEIAGEAENEGRIAVAEPIERLVEMMAAPRHVVISVPSGAATDDMINQLATILEPGDVIIDAGNSRFHDSRRHAAELAEQGLEWLDMGVSGGVWGLQVGFCAMLGGKREVFDRFEPVVKTLAPENGYLYCGEAGAGHYTKMVHNGVEYGIMQAYGEGFDILHASDYDLDLAAIARLWNNGSVIRSWLLELAGNAFEKEGNDLEKVHGWVADSGEGRWTVAEAIDHDVPAPIITLSLIERFRSRREPDSYTDRVLAALRNEFGGHAIKDRGSERRTRVDARVSASSPRRPPARRAPERKDRPRRDHNEPRPNPLREGLRLERMAEPCTMVICGATGDLTERKLAPALYNCLLGGFLPPEFTVVGFARRELTDDAVP